MIEIDLNKFCGNEESRPYLSKPFSRGEHTFATNGHILVRVPIISGIPDTETGLPNVKNVIDQAAEAIRYVRLPADANLNPKMEECEWCEGTGLEHLSCKSCACKCEHCGGTKQVEKCISASVGSVIFNIKYLRLIRELGAEIAIANTPDKPIPFRFEGGDGFVMAMRGPYDAHRGELLPDGGAT